MKSRISVVTAITVGVGLTGLRMSALLLFPEAFAAEGVATALRMGDPVWQWGFAAAAAATGMSALGAGYAVGKVGSAATGALAEKPELLGRLLILIGLAEGIAIYGIIIAVLILNSLK